MERSIIDVPMTWFGIAAMDNWHLNMRGKGGGAGITGTGQVVYGNLPRYVVSVTMPPLFGAKMRAWRVVTSKMRGRVNVWRVRMNDLFEPTQGADITHSDGSTFSDGMGYSQSVTAPILAAAAAAATEISVDGGYIDNVIDGGQFISIDDWPYEIIGVEGTGTSMALTLGRPLQRAVTTLSEINMNPTALVTFETDMEGRLSLTPGDYGTTGASLVEWIGADRE